jgi:hypothetical protein
MAMQIMRLVAAYGVIERLFAITDVALVETFAKAEEVVEPQVYRAGGGDGDLPEGRFPVRGVDRGRPSSTVMRIRGRRAS